MKVMKCAYFSNSIGLCWFEYLIFCFWFLGGIDRPRFAPSLAVAAALPSSVVWPGQTPQKKKI
jgi:hypothetical protein